MERASKRAGTGDEKAADSTVLGQKLAEQGCNSYSTQLRLTGSARCRYTSAHKKRWFKNPIHIVELAGKYLLPAIYFQREFVDEGGLMSYGVDYVDLYRRAEVYVE